MFQKAFVLSVLIAAISTGCDVKPTLSIDGNEKVGESQLDYRDQDLQGQIRHTVWKARSAKAEVDRLDANRLSLSISDESFENPCQQMWGAKRVVMVSVPRAVGETVLGQLPEIRTATFFSVFDGNSENAIATEGKVKVTDLAGGKLVGAMVIRADDGYEVNGKFEIAICQGSL
jgi:hypothetical protein